MYIGKYTIVPWMLWDRKSWFSSECWHCWPSKAWGNQNVDSRSLLPLKKTNEYPMESDGWFRWFVGPFFSFRKKNRSVNFLEVLWQPFILCSRWGFSQISAEQIPHRIHGTDIFPYIYHKKSTIHVGKYIKYTPWMVWVLRKPMRIPPFFWYLKKNPPVRFQKRIDPQESPEVISGGGTGLTPKDDLKWNPGTLSPTFRSPGTLNHHFFNGCLVISIASTIFLIFYVMIWFIIQLTANH